MKLRTGMVVVGIAALAVTVASLSAAPRAQKKVAAAGLVDPADAKTMGSKSAPVTLEVYSDFQCPSCRAFYLETLRRVFENYCSTGKVYYIHRDMPLPIHPYSRQAARYANAAALIGKFEKVADALYTAQPQWSVSGQVDKAVESVLTAAEMKRVRELLKDPKVDATIERDVQSGKALSVESTPTIFIIARGQRTPVVGIVSYTVLREYLNQLLGQ